MQTFEEALREQFTLKRGGKKLSRWEKKLQKILDAKPSARRTRILNRMESHARVGLGLSATAKIDWSKIDWAKVFDFIMKLILALLPLLLICLMIAVVPIFAPLLV